MKLSDATFKVGRNGQLEMTVNSYIVIAMSFDLLFDMC